jgi:hypothetical protein
MLFISDFIINLARYLAIIAIIALVICAESEIAVQLTSSPPDDCAAVLLNR